MAEFVRKKRLQREFIRVGLDEEDLASLARRIATATEDGKGEFTIEIETADGHDSFESHDPAFLTSDDMPTEVKSVAIYNSGYSAPIKCKLSTRGNPYSRKVYGSLMLSVEGTGQGVEQLFRDLERELAAKQIFGQWLVQAKEKLWALCLTSLFSAAAVYSVFDIALDSWAQLQPEFWRSAIHETLVGIGVVLMVICLIAGPVWVSRTIEKHLPPVEFSGRLGGRKTKGQRKLFWIAVLVLVPILVNIFSELLLDIVRFWLAVG